MKKKGVNKKSLKNLLPPYKKGQSGNPKGKPKGAISFTASLRRMLKENPDDLEKVNQALMRKAKRGQLGHIQHVYDRIDGPQKQKLDLSLYSDAFNDKERETILALIQAQTIDN